MERQDYKILSSVPPPDNDIGEKDSRRVKADSALTTQLIWKDRETEWQSEKETEWQSDKETERQIQAETDRDTESRYLHSANGIPQGAVISPARITPK